jgi:hypothetical protein
MRPHVEFIHEQDYIWHPAELPHGEGEAVQRNLAYDEEDGSASLRLDFLTDFRRPPGIHDADTEWFVLSGEITVGECELGRGGYVRVPRETVTPSFHARAGTQILLFRDYGDWGFDPTGTSEDSDEQPIIMDTEAMPWEAVPTNAGLDVKLLHRSPQPGIVSALARREAGWVETRYMHHPGFEEAYTLAGEQLYNYGRPGPGTYIFRPAGVKHGAYVTEGEPCIWFLRWYGDPLPGYFTRDPDVVLEGEAENYDPATEGPVIAGIPVRSRSVGPWDGRGR